MDYLSGCVHPDLEGVPRVGLMLTPMMGNKAEPRAVPWGADTGCFAAGDAFRVGRYVTWLEERMAPFRATCRFATAPDVLRRSPLLDPRTGQQRRDNRGALMWRVVGDAAATWERSRPVLPLIRSLGYPAALVAQDGLERLPVPWPAFDAIFIGGGDEFKLSAFVRELVAEARARRKYVHMGRVNSYKRVAYAYEIGCHSVDGTYALFAPKKNIPKLRGWMERLHPPATLWGEDPAA